MFELISKITPEPIHDGTSGAISEVTLGVFLIKFVELPELLEEFQMENLENFPIEQKEKFSEKLSQKFPLKYPEEFLMELKEESPEGVEEFPKELLKNLYR